MSINNKELLKLVKNTTICSIISESSKISKDVPLILAEKDVRIWCAFPDEPSMLSSYVDIKKVKNTSVNYVNRNGKFKDAMIVMSTSDFLRKHMLKYIDDSKITRDVDFTDIIVLSGCSRYTLDNTVIMNLWKYMSESGNSKKIPRLVLLLNNLDVDQSVPFDISQNYMYIKPNFEPSVEYNYNDYKPNESKLTDDLSDKIKERHQRDELDKRYLVYCQSYIDVITLFEKLKKVDNIKIYAITDSVDEEMIRKANNITIPNNRVVVLAIPSVSYVHNISVVFDSVVHKIEFKTPGESIKMKSTNISKSLAEQRRYVAKDTCIRMCTLINYTSFTTQELSEYKRVPLTRSFLELIDFKLSPFKFFRDCFDVAIIREEMNLIKSTKMVDDSAKRLTRLGEFFVDFRLSRFPSIVLHRWMTTQETLFPGIVLACIIDKADSMFFFFPPKQDFESFEAYEERKKKHHDRFFKKWNSDSILGSYLNMWSEFSNTISDLKPTKETLKLWCNDNSVNYRSFYQLLENIVNCFDKVEFLLRREIIIGKFKPEKLLLLAEPIFSSVYSSNICQLVDADKLKYINDKHENYFIDASRHYMPSVKIPYKLFSFSNISVRAKNKDIRKILFYHPVDRRFLKDKYVQVYDTKPIFKPSSKETYNKFPVSRDYNEPSYIPPEDFEYVPSPEYTPTYIIPNSPEYKPTTPTDYSVFSAINQPSPDYRPPEQDVNEPNILDEPSYIPPEDFEYVPSPEYKPNTPPVNYSVFSAINQPSPDYRPPEQDVNEPNILDEPLDIGDQEDEEARLFREAFDDLTL